MVKSPCDVDPGEFKFKRASLEIFFSMEDSISLCGRFGEYHL